MRRSWFFSALMLASLLGYPIAASAQGAVVHASIGAAVGDSNTGVAFGGGVGYRFNRVLGFGVELTGIENLDNFGYIYGSRFDGPDGNGKVFTTNVRVEIPTTLGRVIPYVIGGGGMAAVSRSYPVYPLTTLATFSQTLSTVPGALELLPSLPTIYPGPSTLTSTSVNMALTLGGGASFLLTNHVSIDADLRVLRLLGESSRNIGRFGGGVSYRF